jgi:hypothetical protein
MNFEVKDGNNKLVERICKETEMNPSQLIEYLMGIMQHLYSDYERQKNAGVEKRTFREILTNLFLHSFKSKLRTLDIAENLIESTNEPKRIMGLLFGYLTCLAEDNNAKIDGIKSTLHYAKELAEKEKEE